MSNIIQFPHAQLRVGAIDDGQKTTPQTCEVLLFNGVFREPLDAPKAKRARRKMSVKRFAVKTKTGFPL